MKNIVAIVVVFGHNTVLASNDFCHLLITFANSLDPDQDRHSVRFDLDPNHLSPERFFF